MKKKWMFLLWTLLVGFLTGCAATTAEPVRREAIYPETRGGTAVTGCSEILKDIWRGYAEGERFAVFGGDPQNSVAAAPGDIPIGNTDMLQKRFFLTPELSGQVTEGAALEHLLNRNVFCAGVFQLAEETDGVQFAQQLGNALEEVSWEGGRPQRYLISQPEPGFLLLAYGQTKILETFLIRMNQAYPKGRLLTYQEIPAKTPHQGLQKQSLVRLVLAYRKVLDPLTAFDHMVAENTFEDIGGNGNTGNHQNAEIGKMA